MTKLIFTMIIFSIQAVYAESIESQIQLLAKQIIVNANNARFLTDKEQYVVLKNLVKAEQILRQSSSIDFPTPPRFPENYPPRYSVKCSQDTTHIFQTTFETVKDFAYSSDGYNMESSKAKAFALEWTEIYPCSFANKYMSVFKKLKTFAYSSSGLNYTMTNARDFASKNLSSFCEYYDLDNEFQKHYQFAYGSNGLNLTASAARQYAFNKINVQAFSCKLN